MEHFHVWVRSGKIYSMQERRFDSRTTAHKAAVKLRAEKSDRLVLVCASCPTTKPSKRRPPRWSVIARAVAERFDLKPGVVREVLTEALEAERGRPGAGSAGAETDPGPSTNRNPTAPGLCTN